MHIPDGMLSAPTWAAGWLGAAGMVGWAVRRIRNRFSDGKLVLMAVMASVVFALQMLNFPVAGGTSGHFSGGAAAAIILGPWAAIVIMTSVLAVQALIFADGGITALGANIVNIGVIGPFVGWWCYSLATRIGDTRALRGTGAAVGAWLAVVASAVGAAIMVWLSGSAPFLLVVGSMAFWHALIGIGEAVITVGLVSYLMSVRPGIVSGAADRSNPIVAVAGLGFLAVAAAGFSFLASSHPDGLESVAESLGFVGSGESILASPASGYLVPGVANEALAGVLAGVAGVVVTGALVYGVLRVARSRGAEEER